jgi:hypothetical protein
MEIKTLWREKIGCILRVVEGWEPKGLHHIKVVKTTASA